MGLNPFREQVKRRSDIVVAAVALVVVALLIAWGLFSG